jgi:4,5:9,10-diseco-3-hydroxy-5,9,17-trioxoandrosta-1(10),2-diene-4-oate hydrolase
MQIPTDQYLRVGTINTRYWTAGERGSIVILLHGGSGSVEFWLYNITILGQHHRVYAFDMVGSGRSDKPSASYSLAYQAEFVKAFMDTMGINRATLIGNSMGGGAALQFALKFPQRLEKLVLVDSMGLGREVAWGIRLTSLPGVVRSLRPSRRMLPAMLRLNFYDPQRIPPEWIELRYSTFALPGRQPALAQLSQTNFNLQGVRSAVYQPIVEQLSTIATPTLIIWGKQDRILPVAHAEAAVQGLPNSRLHIFDPCGHHPHLECPEEFNTLVLEFLAN